MSPPEAVSVMSVLSLEICGTDWAAAVARRPAYSAVFIMIDNEPTEVESLPDACMSCVGAMRVRMAWRDAHVEQSVGVGATSS